MKRDLFFAAVFLVGCAIVATPAIAERIQYFTQRTTSTDWAVLKDEDQTTDDPATVAALTTITALSPDRKLWVGCSLRFNASTDQATVTPLFYTSAGVLDVAGDPQVLDAGTCEDAAGEYSSDGRVWWENAGSARVKFRVTTITGTVTEVWGGTR